MGRNTVYLKNGSTCFIMWRNSGIFSGITRLKKCTGDIFYGSLQAEEIQRNRE